jgi:hypothetical protein
VRRPPALPAALAASLRVADRGGTAVAPWADAMGRSADGFRASPDAPAHRLAACERVETAAAAVLRACSASSDAAAADRPDAAHLLAQAARTASQDVQQPVAASRPSAGRRPAAAAPYAAATRRGAWPASADAQVGSACQVPRCATESLAARPEAEPAVPAVVARQPAPLRPQGQQLQRQLVRRRVVVAAARHVAVRERPAPRAAARARGQQLGLAAEAPQAAVLLQPEPAPRTAPA